LALGQRAHAARIQGDLTLAARLFKESLQTAQTMDEGLIMLGAVAGLGGVALAHGQPERAVRLLGATEAARTVMGIGRISNAPHAERIVSATREALGEPGFTQAWAAGRVLILDEAIADAVMLADELTGTTPELTA
jgi:hypothetical protein